jgi:AmmeMemoRadiSam system protein A
MIVKPQDILNEVDQRTLLTLARSSVGEALETQGRPKYVEVLSPMLHVKRGVFVTLLQEGALRGCVGFPYPSRPLAEACQEAAYSAAFEDARFPPLDPGEFIDIEFEISALTEMKPIKLSQIKVGVDGLFISRGKKSGLLLPQVAFEERWTPEEFLGQTCLKAGLPQDAWKKDAEILGFEAQIFGDKDMRLR